MSASEPKRLLFVCVENANRSQMAEAFARLRGGPAVVAASAGSRPAGFVNPRAVEAMAELGADLSAQRSTGLDALAAAAFDAVVTMGCGDACPSVPARLREEWSIPDPRDLAPAAFRAVRDRIDREVCDLLLRLGVPLRSTPRAPLDPLFARTGAEITPAQLGLGEMDPAEFRDAAHHVADLVAGYLETLERRPVLPPIEPGSVRAKLPAAAPAAAEPLGRILDDYRELIEPNVTHWQHPGFMAYFSSTASGPGILGEWLAAGLNSNVMFWKNAPASVELEQTIVCWLRGMLGLPAAFDGMLTDTASISTLLALTVARDAHGGDEVRRCGLAGRPGLAPLRLYTSAEAHFSVDKAAIVIGVGLDGVRRVPVDERFAMRVDALEQALVEDRRAGFRPFAVVATLGTTSSTSLDPVGAIADLAARERLWLHVDAAYGGAAALAAELRGPFAGWERADTIVFNPHKWMFTPFDASLLLFKDAERFRRTFSVVPDYLAASRADDVPNYAELGIQLGRRFRALKLWMLIRWFGSEGLAARIREHCRLARELARWVDDAPDWERTAPVPLATVCLRHRPPGQDDEAQLERHNAEILELVNRRGVVYLSATRLGGRFTLRVAVGNPRVTLGHVESCWRELRDAARAAGDGEDAS